MEFLFAIFPPENTGNKHQLVLVDVNPPSVVLFEGNSIRLTITVRMMITATSIMIMIIVIAIVDVVFALYLVPSLCWTGPWATHDWVGNHLVFSPWQAKALSFTTWEKSIQINGVLLALLSFYKKCLYAGTATVLYWDGYLQPKMAKGRGRTWWLLERSISIVHKEKLLVFIYWMLLHSYKHDNKQLAMIYFKLPLNITGLESACCIWSVQEHRQSVGMLYKLVNQPYIHPFGSFLYIVM